MILNNTTARGVVAFPTVMRTTPTCALSNSSHVFCRSNASNHQGTSSGFYAAGKESVLASLTTTGLVAGEGSYIYFDTAHPSKYFEADAEL